MITDKKHYKQFVAKVGTRFEILTKFPIIGLIIIGLIGVLIRLVFLDVELPIRQDANAYFWYAMDMSILRNVPYSAHVNDGWPMLLSIFFKIFNYTNYQDYATLQRIGSILISSLTIIPIYFLCRKFTNQALSLVGASLFVFEPHIIQNSLFGLTEPLYIFLGTGSLSLFLSNNKKLFYTSFAIAAFATIVRAEGITIFVILLVTFLINNKKEKKIVREIFLVIIIFSVVFVPMTIIKFQTSSGNASIQGIVSYSYGSIIDAEHREEIQNNLLKSIEIMVKRIGQSMIPYFAFFVPFGIILIWKNRNKENVLVMVSLIIYSLVAIRMFIGVGDLRLIFFLYPLFVILSLLTIKYVSDNIEFKRVFLISVIGAVLLLSLFFLYSNTEPDYNREVNQFAKYMIKNVKVSNNFYPESGYIYGVWASSNLKFPILSSDVEYTGPELLDYVKETNFVYLDQSANSVEEYIRLAKDQNLSHLVIDNNEKRQLYFKDVFYHEEKYPYLIKEFDSSKEGYSHYNVKVFKIDYKYFDSKLKND